MIRIALPLLAALILGSCTTGGAGIEPIPANIYTHKTLSGSFAVKNPYLQDLLGEKGIDTEAVWSSILENEGSVQHLDALSDEECAQALKELLA